MVLAKALQNSSIASSVRNWRAKVSAPGSVALRGGRADARARRGGPTGGGGLVREVFRKDLDPPGQRARGLVGADDPLDDGLELLLGRGDRLGLLQLGDGLGGFVHREPEVGQLEAEVEVVG